LCSAVNAIDMSAIESLEAINERLKAGGVTFHFSEVKGPVMDHLDATGFLEILSGEVFLSQHRAQSALRGGSLIGKRSPALARG
jgi:SulP family sulfate permease